MILDKSRLRTVINKVNSISNVYRVFEMEVLAGEDNMQTVHDTVICVNYCNLYICLFVYCVSSVRYCNCILFICILAIE